MKSSVKEAQSEAAKSVEAVEKKAKDAVSEALQAKLAAVQEAEKKGAEAEKHSALERQNTQTAIQQAEQQAEKRVEEVNNRAQ